MISETDIRACKPSLLLSVSWHSLPFGCQEQPGGPVHEELRRKKERDLLEQHTHFLRVAHVINMRRINGDTRSTVGAKEGIIGATDLGHIGKVDIAPVDIAPLP